MRDDEFEKEGSGVRAVLDRFGRQYLEDIRAGEVRSLAEYQRLFPGHDAAIAEEYERLERHLAGNLGELAATLPLTERLRRRYGEGVDPGVTLEAADATE